MASILDAGLVSIFSSIFVFLLVYALAWGALSKLKPFGDKTGPYAIIAFCVALLSAVAPPARNFVMFIAPWYVALAIVIFFILFLIGLFGLSADKDFPKIIKEARVYTWIVILSVVIFLGGLAYSFGQQALDVTQTTPGYPGPVANPDQPNQNPEIIASGGLNPNANPQPGQPGATATNDFMRNFMNTLLHPKVLGLIVTFFIAALAVYFLSAT